jgi:hypothetical protein
VRRGELLWLSSQQGRPIRDITRLWRTDADHLDKKEAKVREDYRQARKDVVAVHGPGPPEFMERECWEVLSMLR